MGRRLLFLGETKAYDVAFTHGMKIYPNPRFYFDTDILKEAPMNRFLSASLALALTASLATGAFAKNHHAHGMSNGSAMNGMPMSHRTTHRNHRYGNDKARCRDSHGRFLKMSDPRCLVR